MLVRNNQSFRRNFAIRPINKLVIIIPPTIFTKRLKSKVETLEIAKPKRLKIIRQTKAEPI